jgi:hypothetical protein
LASRLDDAQVVEPSVDDDDETAPMPGSSRDKRIVAVQAPGSVALPSHGSLPADASSASVAASTVSQVVASACLSDAVVEPPVKKMKTQANVVQHLQSIDTRENRISVAAQHDLLWTTAPGDGRYSVCTAIRKHEPKPSAMIMRQYVQALSQQKPPGRSKTVDLMEQYVYLVLHFDLLPYQTRCRGDERNFVQKCFGHVVQCLLCRDRRQSRAEAKKKLAANAVCMFVERVEETYVGTMRLGCVASRNAPEALLWRGRHESCREAWAMV